MYIIGVYGPSGAGKSTLAKKLAQDLGATYVEVDKYWKNIYYSTWFQKVFVPFFKRDKNLEKPENAVDIGKIRLKDLDVTPQKAYIMRKLLYKYLNYRINRKLRKTNADVIIFDHIKFFEFDAFRKSDYNIYVNTPNDICEKNIMQRDFITENRMKELVENNVVEHSDIYQSIKKDFTISAFSDSYSIDYLKLCSNINFAISNKLQREASKKNYEIARKSKNFVQEKLIKSKNN